MWRSFLAFLASLAAEPAVIDSEPPKAAAAVAVARSSMQKQAVAEDPPLVPVKRSKEGRFECENGVCYWVDPETGKRYRVQNQ